MAKKETNTKSFILRIDSETMSAIEAWAEDEFRSTNGQLQWIIAEALRKAGRLPKKKKAASKKTKEEVDSNVNHQYSVPTIYQRVSRTSIFE